MCIPLSNFLDFVQVLRSIQGEATENQDQRVAIVGLSNGGKNYKPELVGGLQNLEGERCKVFLDFPERIDHMFKSLTLQRK